ncbi:hypothetical protein [Oceaniglobus roseus]|uniref:hypothetical protein n=1 Tax=Oceaniglobus roseus TaxID=1737570 RepID=UPI000C7EC156|nr:hypothetical protein [Kandeliimicrobium roseum]
MSRVRQPKGEKGSLKWVQRAVAHRPDLLQPEALPPIDWVSPKADDDFAEYRDSDFVWKLGLASLAPMLQQFWPRGGPQWDALGTYQGGFVLAEAKAHLGELESSATQASEASLAQIEAAFAQVKAALGVGPDVSWTGRYYQLANRIAHLWFLRNFGLDAHLVLIGFTGDAEMGGPDDSVAWNAAYARAEAALGLTEEHALSARIHHVFPPVAQLTTPV